MLRISFLEQHFLITYTWQSVFIMRSVFWHYFVARASHWYDLLSVFEGQVFLYQCIHRRLVRHKPLSENKQQILFIIIHFVTYSFSHGDPDLGRRKHQDGWGYMTQSIVTYYYLRNTLSREGGCSCNRDSEECMEEQSKQAEKHET